MGYGSGPTERENFSESNATLFQEEIEDEIDLIPHEPASGSTTTRPSYPSNSAKQFGFGDCYL
ncbi:MAG: hypothetical protein KDE31_15070, partial [Caldilineaceae bacterium]|nr:hypothetical protein [Caldilineaceae bacterium]